MNQEAPIEPSAFSKLFAIWVVIVVVVIVTGVIVGGQVYCWQKAVAKKEKQELQQQNVNLQNEIKLLKANVEIEQMSVKKTQSPVKTDKTEKLLKDTLAGREKAVILLLQNGDLEQLAKYVHPEKGLHFSPYLYVDLKKDQVFSREQVSIFLHNHKRYIWGYSDDNGMPIRLIPSDYYKNYVYDKDYADTKEISYNQTTSREFTTSNCFEVYPQAIIVEYRVTESNPKDSRSDNWRSIRLVFEEAGKAWYLVGIIHEQWML
jgi:hypothetical protein